MGYTTHTHNMNMGLVLEWYVRIRQVLTYERKLFSKKMSKRKKVEIKLKWAFLYTSLAYWRLYHGNTTYTHTTHLSYIEFQMGKKRDMLSLIIFVFFFFFLVHVFKVQYIYTQVIYGPKHIINTPHEQHTYNHTWTI